MHTIIQNSGSKGRYPRDVIPSKRPRSCLLALISWVSIKTCGTLPTFRHEAIPSMRPRRPTVLCLSGHDPTGGAGLQADIESVRAMGLHPAGLITALTVQDTVNVQGVFPQRPEDFLLQGRRLVGDLDIAALKMGLLGSAEIALAVKELMALIGPVPLVLDPILAAGGGEDLASHELLEVMLESLVPLATIISPNIPEAYRLTGQSSIEASAADLLRRGAGHVLITGTHLEGGDVINRWYGPHGVSERAWPRLPQTYHGSGCTLSAALAACLAAGLSMAEAIERAETYTYQSLKEAYPLGHGQWCPDRTQVGWDVWPRSKERSFE